MREEDVVVVVVVVHHSIMDDESGWSGLCEAGIEGSTLVPTSRSSLVPVVSLNSLSIN